LLGVGSGKPPEQWLKSAHGYFRDKQAEDPLNAVVFTVLAGAAAFYSAERGQNPKVTSYFAALEYVATSLSVGYSDIFPKTEAGKAIASTLMTYGPALAARAFDVPGEAQQRAVEGERSEAALRDIAGKLELILQELQSQRGAAVSDG
jgi:hypothetical protein